VIDRPSEFLARCWPRRGGLRAGTCCGSTIPSAGASPLQAIDGPRGVPLPSLPCRRPGLLTAESSPQEVWGDRWEAQGTALGERARVGQEAKAGDWEEEQNESRSISDAPASTNFSMWCDAVPLPGGQEALEDARRRSVAQFGARDFRLGRVCDKAELASWGFCPQICSILAQGGKHEQHGQNVQQRLSARHKVNFCVMCRGCFVLAVVGLQYAPRLVSSNLSRFQPARFCGSSERFQHKVPSFSTSTIRPRFPTPLLQTLNPEP